MKIVQYCFVLIFIFLFSPQKIFAAAPQILDYPHDTIQMDTSFSVTASMSGLSKSSTYRLRVALAQSGTSNYFGSTFDGNLWHYGSINDGNYIAITTDNSGLWSGVLQGQVDSEDANFTTGSGTYDLKIGRYTQTGTSATWSDPVSVNIFVAPTPTFTPTPIPTSTPMPTSQPTVTLIPTPIQKLATITPTKIVATATSTNILKISPSLFLESILGTEDAHTGTPSPIIVMKKIIKSTKPFPWMLIIGGIICLIGAGSAAWWFGKKRIYGSNNSNNEFN